jgi:DNA-binding response OmpR family regulator
MVMRILLVEDEQHLALAVAELLKQQHIAVDLAADGLVGMAYAETGSYDAIVLDIMLPGIDGITITSQLRNQGIMTPIILLTARSTTEDKVSGLDAGADDYLTKPFQTSELLARIRALTRRSTGIGHNGLISYGDLTYSPQTLAIECGNRKQNLTVKLAQLLELLLANKGSIVAKETMIVKLWGYDSYADANHAEALVSLLRKQLSSVGTTVRIRTVRGLGYALLAD